MNGLQKGEISICLYVYMKETDERDGASHIINLEATIYSCIIRRDVWVPYSNKSYIEIFFIYFK